MINRRLDSSCSATASLDLPRVSPLIMDQPRIIIAFVEIFEDGREDLGFFVWEGDSFVRRFEELASAGCLEKWRDAEDVFVCGEETLFTTDDKGDY